MTQRDYDSGNQLHVQTHGKKVRGQHDTRDTEFTQMMEVVAFRAFVWDLLDRTGALRASADSSTMLYPHHVYFREGQRDIGIGLIDLINRLCPRQYDVMAAEAKQRQQELNNG